MKKLNDFSTIETQAIAAATAACESLPSPISVGLRPDYAIGYGHAPAAMLLALAVTTTISGFFMAFVPRPHPRAKSTSGFVDISAHVH